MFTTQYCTCSQPNLRIIKDSRSSTHTPFLGSVAELASFDTMLGGRMRLIFERLQKAPQVSAGESEKDGARGS